MPDTATATPPPGNRLLASLPRPDYRRLLPHLDAVPLAHQQVLHRPGRPIRFVYFPEGGLVSLLAGVGNGTFAEAGMVGREGLVGISAFLGRDTTPFRAVVQVPGHAHRLDVAAFRAELRRAGPLVGLLSRYLHSLLTQVSQVAACNSHHSVERRCCRWLVLARDLLGADEFLLTQKYLAAMLGVRRTGVTVVAGNLREAGLIHYRRGWITILDGPGLEAACCRCYRVIRAALDGLGN